ncbi:MAG: CPBP family intramembrane metalloprotease [Thermoplasmata archaeon]|nr:MAG: CPBP family intramembrane metalloprotease [Thermoplasmata archaeon]
MNGEKEHQPQDEGEHYEVTVFRPAVPPAEPAFEPITEPPEDVAIVQPIEEDNKWYGVPPKGEQPLPGKWEYVLLILLVMVIEICIWAVYRYFSAPYFESFGTLTFYLAHIVAAPTIHLIPILIFWRFFRKEKGLPFVFTKKLIMSSVIVGFCAAIIWRLLQEFSYDALSGASGGTVSGTFNFFNLMASSNVLLFSVMTFVQFFVVGPVEELEFRSFAYDQSARVLPNWHAILFSSVLFGCSHIPIALFVYQFPPHIFGVALFGWISAGVVFGALYAWSRNIFACIVMHGMGNWQLSVYYFQSTEAGGMSVGSVVAVELATTFIADCAMIIIFFLIHKFYWQPHRRGEPALGGKLANFQKFLHEHDFMQRPLKTTAVFLVVFIVVTCGIIMGLAHALGESDLSKMYSAGIENEEVMEEGIINETEEVNIYHFEATDTIMVPGFGVIGGGATTLTYDFPVEDNASSATIITENAGNNMRPDIDLYVYAPDGSQVGSSAGATADEAVKLDSKDFDRHGYGTYTAEVHNFSNVAVTYRIEIDVFKEVPVNQTDDGE